ncbi:MAG: DUF4162 domain-containing protein [Actinomycetota bacterium]|nr:DUF4162 domain-containing protein [Actinomycetota bacterium]
MIIRSGRVVADGTLDELRQKRSRRQLEIVVAGADPNWVDTLGSARVLERDGTRVLLPLEHAEDDQQVLAAAAGAGRVERFGWRQPSLSELYPEGVSEQ